MANRKIKKTAEHFLQTVDGNISPTDLVRYLIQAGAEVLEIDFSKWDIVSRINATGFFLKYSAVTYQTKNKFVVFVNRCVPAAEKQRALLREIGHLALEHAASFGLIGTSAQMQKEADFFADCVLLPQKDQKRRVLFTVIISVLILAIISCTVGLYINNSSKSVTASIGTINKTVYVTKNGSKYHAELCRHIRGSSVIPLSLEKAQTMNYDPCADCMK